MTDAEELVEELRSKARFKYGETVAADLMLEAADMIEQMHERLEVSYKIIAAKDKLLGRQEAALSTLSANLDPGNNPPDRKWVMDRAFETAQRGLMITAAPAA